jgi:hypothetical protein
LTIKFTRRSQKQRAAGGFAADSQTPNPGKTARISRPWTCSSHPLYGPAPKDGSQEDTPADLSALKKITQPCRLPNRFSCQTSSCSRLGGKVEHRCPMFIIRFQG